MATTFYFREDIAQGITAVAAAMLSTAMAHGGTNVEYCRGVLDTCRAQALNYGIPWPALFGELQEMLTAAERERLLDLVACALPTVATR